MDKVAAYGGDINESYVLTLSNGERIFLKENRGKESDFFEAEAAGLRALADTGRIRMPRVLGTGRDGEYLYLLLEMIEGGRRSPAFWETFGRSLAQMHMADTASYVPGGKYGFYRDDYIGATRQINRPHPSWTDFYREERLEKQFRMARSFFDDADSVRIHRLLDHLEDHLAEPERPALLHGDLWGGNFMTDGDGNPVLIDPAVYVGNAEADIAMTELFGGFAPAFYEAYRSEYPFAPGYEDRRDLYHLYHLLNHLNLFGSSYLPGVLRILRRYGG